MHLLIAFLLISPQILTIDGKVGPTVASRGGPPAADNIGDSGIDDKDESPGADEGDNGGSTLDVISSGPMDVMGTPQPIGDLEFDVEVDEQIPRKGQKAPEVDVEGDKNNPMGDDGRVLSDVSVDLVSKSVKRIGDIELDMNVMNAKTRHPHHQNPDEPGNEEDVALQQQQGDQTPDATPDPAANPDNPPPGEATLPPEAPVDPVNPGNDTTTAADNGGPPTNETPAADPPPPPPPDETTSLGDPPTTRPTPTTTKPAGGKGGNKSIPWVPIVIAFIIICVVLIGLIWCYTRFNNITKSLDNSMEEPRIGAATLAKPTSTTDGPPGETTSEGMGAQNPKSKSDDKLDQILEPKYI
ncbi:unnamed protein product [Oppiella nova]|uniref:Uncharacterized protein n=1 Tax=Oppiella nova TaxID=334625 RepID=A0A7R9M4M0_9ACAR|nr:unnamed protein product [Oppiella nova]CAG2170661.1 unnamed protein product [Oppiella nova]